MPTETLLYTRYLQILLVATALVACSDEGDDGGGGDGDDVGAGGMVGTGGEAGDGDGDQSGTGGMVGTGGTPSGDGDGDGDLSMTALADLPKVIAKADCEAWTACLGESTLADILDYQDCEVALAEELTDDVYGRLQASVDAGRIAYDPTMLPSCYDALVGLGCDVLLTARPAACQAAYGGQVADGEACETTAECGPRSYCKGVDACPDSVCARRKAEGADCSGSGECEADLYCGGGTCKAYSDVDGPCGDAGGICRFGTACVTGNVCAVPTYDLAEDESCDPDAAEFCAPGLSCSVAAVTTAIDWQCQPTVGANEPCNLAKPTECPAGYFCKVDSPDEFEGVCSPQGAVDEACVGNPGGAATQCAPGHGCVEGTCVAFKRIGEDCALDSICRSGSCVGGKCAAPTACE